MPARPPVSAGRVRICVTGFTLSHNVGRAARVANAIAAACPDKYETWFYFDKRFRDPAGSSFLDTVKSELSEEQQTQFAAHRSAPFCWLETADGGRDAKGGRDRLSEWAVKEFKDVPEVLELASTGPSLLPWRGDLFATSHKPTVQSAESTESS